MAPGIQGCRKPVVEGAVCGLCAGLRCIFRGRPSCSTRGLIELGLVPPYCMRFFRSRYARIDVCFRSGAPHLHHSEAERAEYSLLKRSRLPCGPDFPQTLLTCRRPVFPPDRAPLCFRRMSEPDYQQSLHCAWSPGTSIRSGCGSTMFGGCWRNGRRTSYACKRPRPPTSSSRRRPSKRSAIAICSCTG